MSGPVRIPPDDQGVPTALREPAQWICWRVEDRDGESTKVPIDPSTGTRASTTDPDTWASFGAAMGHYQTEGLDGVGFVFAADGPFAGIDLDDCRDPESGTFDEWARDVLDDLDTYAEVSPSGTGAHAILRGEVPDGGNRSGDVEMYDDARYFTVTGEHLNVTPTTVETRQGELTAVHAEHVGENGDEAANGDERPGAEPDANGRGFGGSDEALIAKAKDAKNGDKFARLWSGDTSGYPSHSEADFALCDLLAFWTGGERGRINSLFRQSGLYREKWDRNDYRERTIRKALRDRSDYYEPDDSPDRPTAPSDRGMDVSLTPAEVAAWAGIGEDETVADLSDREKAAAVWELVYRSDDIHICVRPNTDALWAFDDGVWTRDGERTLRQAGRQAVGSMNFGSNVVTELKTQARSDGRVEVPADEFGVKPGTVAVVNGLLYLPTAAGGGGTDALRDLRPEDYAQAQLPVEYDPDATAEEWDTYVREWAEDGRADALQEYIGYCLHVGAMPIHRTLLLVGSGANGKSTFLAVVRALLGRENITSTELQTLANERDALADFEGALANIDDDLSARKLGSGLGMFKKLTGGDRVRGRRLYQEGFQFQATGKHLYAANEVPNVTVPDEDEAFWRRWLLVEFPNYYPPSERDTDLADRLTHPNRLSGVLNWAIDGWQRLLEQGHFTNEDRLAHAKRSRWQAWGDSVEKFINECVTEDSDAPRISTSDVYDCYVAWCTQEGEEPAAPQSLTTTLKAEDLGYKQSLRIGGGSPQRGFTRLAFTDDAPTDTDESTRGGQVGIT
jgi:putative DNA primase/helicase